MAKADPNVRRLQELMKVPGNEICADCGLPGPEWASYNIGVFLCTQCAGIHRNMGSHISKVKSLKLDKWEIDQLEALSSLGNTASKGKYEDFVPLCYKRPTYKDAQVLREQWIRAKYEREEFKDVERQFYLSGRLEGYMWKRGKEDEKFQARKFVLSETDATLKYYVKENREPKAVIQISDLNATFVPEKVGNPNGMQLSYVKDGSTRNLFVYTDDGKDIVDWFVGIRSAKLNRLRVAFPGTSEAELAQCLTRDFPKEGWLLKTGPRSTDGYKKRWFTLDDRKLMYMEGPLDAYAKGEIFVGYRGDGYSISTGVPPGCKDQGYPFTLKTPDRSFILSAANEDDREEWMAVVQKVLDRHLSPQDSSMAVYLVRKRSSATSKLSIWKS